MIRKLKECDRVNLLEYVGREAAMNLFIIGDVEQFGFESDMQELWGDFNDEEQYRGVLLRYKDFFIVYGEGDYDKKEFAEIIKSYKNTKIVSGREDIVEEMREYIKFSKITVDYFSELKELQYESELIKEVEQACEKDAERIFEILCGIGEFQVKKTLEETRENITRGGSRDYVCREEGKIVARAATTAENKKSAMIVGVCTDKDYRQKGYASACVSKLCKDLLEEGKTACLFYDNPAAGRIYKKIGFKDIGKWSMAKL